MHSTLKIVATVALIGSFLLPAVSGAASLTTAQVTSVIGLLQSFNVDAKTIETVQAVLTNSPQPLFPVNDNTQNEYRDGIPGQIGKVACVSLLRDLGLGSYGEDVRKLQHVLAADGENGFVGTTTGYYGPITAKAMVRFQLRNGIASTSIGVVGPLTRGFFNRRCGLGIINMPGRLGTSTAPAPTSIQGTSTDANQ